MLYVLLFVATILMMVPIIWFDAKSKKHFTDEVVDNFIYHIGKGGKSLYRVIVGYNRKDPEAVEIIKNLKPHKIDVICKDDDFLGLGFWRISLRYPLIKLMPLQILAEGVKTGGEELPSDTDPLRKWMYQEVRIVDALLIRFPRAFLITGVELKDNFNSDVVLMGTFRNIHPLKVYRWPGFFKKLQASAEGTFNDSVVKDPAASNPNERAYSFKELTNINKTEGSPFAKKMQNLINYGDEDVSKPEEGKVYPGIVSELGIVCESLYVWKFAISEGQQGVAEALRMEEINTRKAAADIIAGEGRGNAYKKETEIKAEADAKKIEKLADADEYKIKKLADGERYRLDNMLTVPIEKGVKADTAMVVTGSYLKTEKLPQNLRVLVEAHSNAKTSLDIPTEEPEETK